MHNDRMEIYSLGGMMNGKLIPRLDSHTVPSKRRNSLLANFFSRLELIERRDCEMKKNNGCLKVIRIFN